jgi:hypothetical protein
VRPRKADVVIAKNYLSSDEIAELNRLTTMFLDFAEDRASRGQQIVMAEWVTQTNRFIEFTDRNVLNGPGAVSRTSMETEARKRYGDFDTKRREIELKRSEAEHVEELNAEAKKISSALKDISAARKEQN